MSYNYDEITSEEARDLLRQWRENNERRSEEVMEIWQVAVGNGLDIRGSENHIILEQVLFAALDCHQYSVAKGCITVLSSEFPGSLRVMRLQAALHEANGKYDEALEVLDNIIQVDETNAAARKRRVAIWKAQGLIVEAIKELVDYIKKFMSDVEAWQELCNLYLQVQDYSRAAFCVEELLLHQPHNHLHHQRLADIRYTMGGMDNMELAKSYYCHALKLNPDNVRALLGLFLVTNNLLSQYKTSGNSGKRKEVWKLCQWAQSRVAECTRNANEETESGVPTLSQMTLALAITD